MSTNRAASRKRKSSIAAGASQPKDAAGVAVTTEVSAPEVLVDGSGWEKQYGYVFSDLRKLGLVSLGLFAVIIVLGFFL
jgi:hypothetical protein